MGGKFAGMTMEQAAKLMNVSVRTVRDAGVLLRVRPDLAAKCEAGELSINRAMVLAGLRQQRTRVEVLLSAWKASSETERAAFLELIGLQQ